MNEYKERFYRLIQEPGTIDTITAHISNGGSILDLCTDWDVRFSDVNEWLCDDKIRLKQYEVAMTAQNEWVIQRILQEIRRMSFVDVRDLFNSDGTARPMSEWSEDAAKAVIGLKHTDPKYDKDGEVVVPEIREIKLERKIDAIKLLGNCKELRLFADRVDHSFKVSLLDLVEGSIENAEEKEVKTVLKDEDNI